MKSIKNEIIKTWVWKLIDATLDFQILKNKLKIDKNKGNELFIK